MNACIKGASLCQFVFITLCRDGEVIIQMILTYFNCTDRKFGLGTRSETYRLPSSFCENNLCFQFEGLSYTGLFSPCIFFALLHLQTVAPCLKLAQSWVKKDNLRHWNLPSLKFAHQRLG